MLLYVGNQSDNRVDLIGPLRHVLHFRSVAEIRCTGGSISKYEGTMDQELWTKLLAGNQRTDAAGGRCVCTQQMAALFCTE